MSEKFRKNLTEGSVTKNLIKFATPFLLSNLLQALYSVVDMIVVGQYCGKEGITGVSIGGQINMLVTGAAFGLAVSGTVLIAQYAGAKKYDEQKKTIGTMSSLYLILSVIITTAMLFLGKPILTLLNTPESAFGQTMDYYSICMSGVVFMFAYNVISSVLRGMGDSIRPLIFVVIATVCNIVFDIILVGKYNMGAAGAAWATVAAQALSVVLSLIYLVKSGFFLGYTLKDFKIDKDKAKLLFKIGLPSSVQQLVVSLSFLTLTSLTNSLPNADVASACQGIGGKVNSFAILPGLAMSSAIASMAGQNIGAGEYKRAKKTMLVGYVIALAISLIVFTLVQLFSPSIMRWFSSEIEVIELGAEYLKYISLDYVIACGVFCMNGLAIGAGYTNIALVNAMVSAIVVRVPLAYILVNVFSMGFNGIGLSIGLGSIGALIIGFIFIQSGKWKKQKIRL